MDNTPTPMPEAKSSKASKSRQPADKSFDYREFLRRAWNAKYWIALCVAAGLAISFVHYKKQAPLYTSTADIMFLSNESGGTQNSGGAMAALSDLGMTANLDGVNVYNEMEVFHAPALMAMVVEKLNLNTTYSADAFGHDEDLYGRNPVIVTFYDLEPGKTASFALKKTDATHVVASSFMVDGKPASDKALRIPLGTVVDSPLGKISIAPTSNFSQFPDFVYVNHYTIAGMAGAMAAGVTTERKGEYSWAVSLSYTDVNPTRANDVTNALIQAYHEMWLEEQNRSAVSTSQFIKDRLAVIEQELNGIDTDISHVKAANATGDVTAAASTFYNQSLTYDSEAYETATQLSIAQFLRDHIKSHPEAMIPANTGASGTIESQIQEYNKMVIKRDQLLQNSTAANPVVAQLNADMASTRALILQGLGNLISSYQVEINRAADRGQSFAGRASSVPAQEKEILSIERQQKVKENLYIYLLQKREENELARLVTANNIRILRPASASPAGVHTMLKNLGAGLLAGAALPLLIIYMLMQMNTTISRKSDIESLSIPFLGEMPLSESKRKKKHSLKRLLHPYSRRIDDDELEIVVKDKSRSYINEAFRMVRTQLDFIAGGHGSSQVIMLTSFNPGSGKTFISINLAKSLALKGKKVIVVDMDLRRASLSKFAGNATRGVSTYLTGKVADLHELIIPSHGDFDVDILPVGAIPPNPVELLIGGNYEKMVEKLRQDYDYIVLDCPPYDLVADTSILARAVDMSIFVVRAGLFVKALLPELEAIYTEHRLPHMALILNGVDPTRGYYASRYGYKGYGYGNKHKGNEYFVEDNQPGSTKK